MPSEKVAFVNVMTASGFREWRALREMLDELRLELDVSPLATPEQIVEAVRELARERVYHENAAHDSYDGGFADGIASVEVEEPEGGKTKTKTGHHIDKRGRFQSDRHPTLEPDKIVVSFKHTKARPALAALAEAYRLTDPELADDITGRLATLRDGK